MIPSVFNGMIAIMLAKFVLNDVPHYLFSETTHRTILIVPPFKPHKHPAEPIARVVIVPGGSRWQCTKCGRVLEAGSEAVKVGGKVYCVECARGGNPGTASLRGSALLDRYSIELTAFWEYDRKSVLRMLERLDDETLSKLRGMTINVTDKPLFPHPVTGEPKVGLTRSLIGRPYLIILGSKPTPKIFRHEVAHAIGIESEEQAEEWSDPV